MIVTMNVMETIFRKLVYNHEEKNGGEGENDEQGLIGFNVCNRRDGRKKNTVRVMISHV